MLIGIPVRSFSSAKLRLSKHLADAERSALMKLLAGRVVAAAQMVADVVVVSNDEEVRLWCNQLAVPTLPDRGTLDSAAEAIVNIAGDRFWGVLHADLPLLQRRDLELASALARVHGTAIAPSADGGTSLILSSGSFRFAYGPGSFRRHIAQRPIGKILVRTGLALDVDEPSHLRHVDQSVGSPP